LNPLKIPTTIRFDADVLAAMKASGKGSGCLPMWRIGNGVTKPQGLWPVRQDQHTGTSPQADSALISNSKNTHSLP